MYQFSTILLVTLIWKSERKFSRRLHFGLRALRFLCSRMRWISIYIDCLIWGCRTSIFAMSAAYTNLFGSFGNNKGSLIRYHMHSLCRATFGTGSTGCFFGINDTVIFDKKSLPYLSEFFCINVQGQHCTGGTNLDTPHTFVCTEASVIVQVRLHYSGNSIVTI